MATEKVLVAYLLPEKQKFVETDLGHLALLENDEWADEMYNKGKSNENKEFIKYTPSWWMNVTVDELI